MKDMSLKSIIVYLFTKKLYQTLITICVVISAIVVAQNGGLQNIFNANSFAAGGEQSQQVPDFDGDAYGLQQQGGNEDQSIQKTEEESAKERQDNNLLNSELTNNEEAVGANPLEVSQGKVTADGTGLVAGDSTGDILNGDNGTSTDNGSGNNGSGEGNGSSGEDTPTAETFVVTAIRMEVKGGRGDNSFHFPYNYGDEQHLAITDAQIESMKKNIVVTKYYVGSKGSTKQEEAKATEYTIDIPVRYTSSKNSNLEVNIVYNGGIGVAPIRVNAVVDLAMTSFGYRVEYNPGISKLSFYQGQRVTDDVKSQIQGYSLRKQPESAPLSKWLR